jgi:hypothetical protein
MAALELQRISQSSFLLLTALLFGCATDHFMREDPEQRSGRGKTVKQRNDFSSFY